MKKTTLKAEPDSFIEINFYCMVNFQHLLREKATESKSNNNNNNNKNNKNNGNIVIRKQLTFGTAEMTVMQIFHNSFQLSTPTVKK